MTWAINCDMNTDLETPVLYYFLDCEPSVGGELIFMLQYTSIKSKECTITSAAIVSHWGAEVHTQSINTVTGCACLENSQPGDA